MSDLLNGRVALVTGASRGIGAAIARTFAREGALVAAHGRDTAALAGVVEQIEAAGGQAIAVTADVTDFGQIEAMRARIEATIGPVDILVANAGGNLTPPAPLEDIPLDGWTRTVDANLTSAFLTLKSFLPGMKARARGSIVTIASAAARRPHPGTPIAYAAAKAGLILLTQDVATQAGPHGVRANCIAPEDHPDREQPGADPGSATDSARRRPPDPAAGHAGGRRRGRALSRPRTAPPGSAG